MSKRGIELYLADIQNAVRKIEKYTRGIDFAEFCRNEQIVDAVVRNLSVIGEAAINIPKEIKAKHPDVAWREISGMRNKVVHEYFGIDDEILWKTVQDDLPVVKRQVSAIIRGVK